MSGNHPRLVLDGIKTITRRTAGLQKINENPDDWELAAVFQDGLARFYNAKTEEDITVKCPYGGVGDGLYIKETHYKYGYWAKTGKLTRTGKPEWEFIPDMSIMLSPKELVSYSDNPPDEIVTDRFVVGWFKRPSMFMFKKDARIWTEISGLRAERVQDISQQDSLDEGIDFYAHRLRIDPRIRFADLWDSLNAERGYGWDRNIWVWVITFKQYAKMHIVI